MTPTYFVCVFVCVRVAAQGLQKHPERSPSDPGRLPALHVQPSHLLPGSAEALQETVRNSCFLPALTADWLSSASLGGKAIVS